MHQNLFRRLCVGAMIGLALLCNSAAAVVISSGNGNTTAPADDPGFANVGKSVSGAPASVVYLGNRWVLTANHVDISAGSVTFGANSYTVDSSTITQLGAADLKLFRILTDPGLPALNIASTGPASTDPIIMIGNGLDRGDPKYWNVTGPSGSPTWTEVSSTDPHNASGFEEIGGHNIRWGENLVDMINQTDGATSYFTTVFDSDSPFADEAQASKGDSGGAAFEKIGSQWYLTGIIFADGIFTNQPASTAVYGDESIIADLSTYRSQILAIVPEPASISLALLGAAGLYVLARRRRA